MLLSQFEYRFPTEDSCIDYFKDVRLKALGACPKCGHTEKANRNKKIHFFCCKNCGYKSNDDRIGAMNLHRMGIELLVPDAVVME